MWHGRDQHRTIALLQESYSNGLVDTGRCADGDQPSGIERQPSHRRVSVSSILITLLGAGWMDKLIRIMPQSVASAMLAILLQFGLGLFQAMQTQLSLILIMLLVFVVKPLRRASSC